MKVPNKEAKEQAKLRYYDLDWLRVIAFGLLILFHVCLFFSYWKWFIKNDTLTYAVNLPLMFLRQWRMPLLFMISGAGLYWSLRTRTAVRFTGERVMRILVPLLFGIFFIVPPQIYIERLLEGYTYSYVDFYLTIFRFQPYPNGNFGWHHLWYLAYLLLYSLAGLPLWLMLQTPTGRQLTERWANFFDNAFLLVTLPVCWLLVGRSLNLPENETYLINDWKTHFKYFSLLFFGYTLSSQLLFRQTIKRIRWVTAGLAVFLTSVLTLFFWRNWHDFSQIEEIIYNSLRVLNYWCWLLAIFGLASYYLNFKNRFLQYTTQAVYPFYILHQTILFIVGYHLIPLDWPWQLKFVTLTVTTLGGCWLIFHFIIRPFRPVKLFFGSK